MVNGTNAGSAQYAPKIKSKTNNLSMARHSAFDLNSKFFQLLFTVISLAL